MPSRWNQIINRAELIDHGLGWLRKDAVDIIETGLRASDPYSATRKLVTLKNNILHVGQLHYDLSDWKNIYVIGAGKASQPIALALEEVLGDHIQRGALSIKQGEEHLLNHIELIDAAHPVPDENSYKAAQTMIDIARQAGKGDIVFSIITGGSSALLISPVEGITLEDKYSLNKLLLNSGASIREINAVRKHVSRIKGGRLALEVFPAELINLTVSDVIGDPLDYITDLTVPDTSTWEDALLTIEKYKLLEKTPRSIRNVLETRAGGETPKSFSHPYHSFILVGGDALCQAAVGRSRELGYTARILTLEMEGECCQQARAFVQYVKNYYDSLPAGNFAIIAGGETTVTLQDLSGEGGPNQEFALCAAETLGAENSIVIAAIDADGTDGPTDAAGGIVDRDTILRAAAKGVDIQEARLKHDSYNFLKSANDLVRTGPTGTNVNDLMLALISK